MFTSGSKPPCSRPRLQNFDAADLQRRFDDDLNKLTADFDFDKTEQAIVREACYSLDLSPHEFDL